VCKQGGLAVILPLGRVNIFVIILCVELVIVQKGRIPREALEGVLDLPTRAAASCAREMDILRPFRDSLSGRDVPQRAMR
jgi:hypothetical protein